MKNSVNLVKSSGFRVVSVDGAGSALDLLRRASVDLALVELSGHDGVGFGAIEKIREQEPDMGIIAITGAGGSRDAVKALKMGAYDYITAPFDKEQLLTVVKRYLGGAALKERPPALPAEPLFSSHFAGIIYRSGIMAAMLEMVQRVSVTSAGVLLTGESGTGKELVARAIHASGNRTKEHFVAINCGAVSPALMESELFGHEKGAFTGAMKRKAGKFEYADGGTVFLDEISTLSMELQVKLLRVLNDQSFQRVGGNRTIESDIRVIAATNVDLYEMVNKGTFRDDLYWRLNVVPIRIPPLRERVEDIGPLVFYFIERYSKEIGKNIRGVSSRTLDILKDYSWPGNIRELENLIERLAVTIPDNSIIGTTDIPAEFRRAGETKVRKETDLNLLNSDDFHASVKAFERGFIEKTLVEHGWNRQRTADKLKIHRNTLLNKMREHALIPPKDGGGATGPDNAE